ncbi:MAG: hypothetical protein WAU15_07120 [Nitrosomonas sp.]
MQPFSHSDEIHENANQCYGAWKNAQSIHNHRAWHHKAHQRFNAKILRYCSLDKAHTWRTLLAMAYNMKRLPKFFAERQMIAQT